MYKRLLFIILLTISNVVFSYSQTLKITDVSSENEKLYSSVTKRNLGKNLIIEIYDKTAKVTLANEKPLIMEVVTEGVYRSIVEKREREIMTADLTVNKLLGVVTSAIFKITISEIVGQHRQASYVVTAKRF